jgi:putative methyltransferase (TIGR04325 family)
MTLRMPFKDRIKSWIPPVLLAVYRDWHKGGIRFVGDHASWDEAVAKSIGYDADLIIEKVSTSLLQVKQGKAVYERDSVLFDRIEYPFPLLAGLLHVAAERAGRLSVLDFGGSLGSTYFQCRNFLAPLEHLSWHIVEQEKFVRCGRDLFSSDQLQFHYSIEECLQAQQPDVVLFSSVLQYLRDPAPVIKAIMDAGVRYIIVDRAPASELDRTVICVQHVPPEIYNASYPCAIFSVADMKKMFSGRYELVAEFDAFGGGGQVKTGSGALPFTYKGMIWRLRQDRNQHDTGR